MRYGIPGNATEADETNAKPRRRRRARHRHQLSRGNVGERLDSLPRARICSGWKSTAFHSFACIHGSRQSQRLAAVVGHHKQVRNYNDTEYDSMYRVPVNRLRGYPYGKHCGEFLPCMDRVKMCGSLGKVVAMQFTVRLSDQFSGIVAYDLVLQSRFGTVDMMEPV